MPSFRSIILGLSLVVPFLDARAGAVGRGNRFLLQNATDSTVRLWLYETDHRAGAYQRKPVTLNPGQKEWFETEGKDYWLASYCFNPDEAAPWSTWDWHYFKELAGAGEADRIGQVRGEPCFLVLDSMVPGSGAAPTAFRLVAFTQP